MNRDLSINVNVNPNGVPTATQTRISEPTIATENNARGLNSSIKAGAVIAVAQRGLSIASSNIGELTGSRSKARKTAAVGQVAALGYAFATNPAIGAAALAFQLGTSAVQRAVENRNVQNEVEYNRTLRTATYNNGRK
jgi:hypothetical protein